MKTNKTSFKPVPVQFTLHITIEPGKTPTVTRTQVNTPKRREHLSELRRPALNPRQVRRAFGENQTEFGKRLGLHQVQVSKWERGELNVTPARAARLVAVWRKRPGD